MGGKSERVPSGKRTQSIKLLERHVPDPLTKAQFHQQDDMPQQV